MLFAFQSRSGTGNDGALFRADHRAWFIVIAIVGISHISDDFPGIPPRSTPITP